jgi:3-oxoacyl-[acyl-carrier protein] reductase
MDLGYRGRRVLVVGGSLGIGQSSATLMATEGADVLIASRSETNLAKAAEDIQSRSGSTVATRVVDVTRPDGGDNLARAVAERWDGLDLLVTAVGGSVRAAFSDLTDDDWMANYTFNILSTVRAIRALLPLLRRGNDPAIVTLGGASARMPRQHQIVSNVHKAGLLSLTKTLAEELAPDRIRVNSIAPGPTLTPLWIARAERMAAERGVTPQDILAEFSRLTLIGRFGEPDEVAFGVVMAGSPRAAFITGQTINVDGGAARGLL